jgi:hypothetical protein
MSRRVGEPEPALLHRRDNLGGIAKAFRDASEKTKKPALEDLRTEALSGMWNFSRIRAAIKTEAAALAEYFRGEGPTPEQETDYLSRIGRLSIALYLLDKSQELSAAAGKKNNVLSISIFDVARRGVENLLSESFFSKGSKDIIHDYLDAEPALVSCAAVFSVRLLSLEDAVRAYKMQAAKLVEAEM